jgi:hypothetical protein
METSSNTLQVLPHVFISYSHKNLSECRKVEMRLTDAGISCWVDDHIEAGSRWQAQIDEALEDAYALVVVVTPESMKSTYVTYEWSWALGNSLPIFPLLMKGKTKIHDRLSREIQMTNCLNSIPNHVIDSIRQLMEMPRDLRYLNRLISEMTMPFKILTRLFFWLYEEQEDLDAFGGIPQLMLTETIKLSKTKLPELMVNQSHAFSSKQRRVCRQLVVQIDKFYEIFQMQVESGIWIASKLPSQGASNAKDYWSTELLDKINFFKVDHHYEAAFEEFDRYLSAIANHQLDYSRSSFFLPQDILKQSLPEDKYEEVWSTIERIRQRKYSEEI